MFSYAVIGTGAIGGYYGGRLAESGKDVQFLARSDKDHIERNGLRILSPDGNIHIAKPRVYSSIEDIQPVDIVMVAMKTTSNTALESLLKPLVSDGTAILLMQNGLGMEEEIQTLFPESPVIGGMCFICSQKREPGVVTHLDYGAVTFGAACDRGREMLSELTEDFSSAGIPVRTAENLGEARWRKLLWNIPYNGLSVLLNADTREIMENPSSGKIVRSLMEEVVQGARACGYNLEDHEIDTMMSSTEKMTPYKPSMKLDYDSRRPLELEYMYRSPLAAAEKQGCDLPRISLICRQLEFLDAAN